MEPGASITGVDIVLSEPILEVIYTQLHLPETLERFRTGQTPGSRFRSAELI
jgi:hypothetical protein